MKKYVLALDQGTTSSRTIVFNKKVKLLLRGNMSLSRYILNLVGLSITLMKYLIHSFARFHRLFSTEALTLRKLPQSASQISVKQPFFGIKKRASPFITQLCGSAEEPHPFARI